MTIKTAAILTVGVSAGFLAGLATDERTKERIARKMKEKIFFILTGEEMPKPGWRPNEKDPGRDSGNCNRQVYTYNDFYTKKNGKGGKENGT